MILACMWCLVVAPEIRGKGMMICGRRSDARSHADRMKGPVPSSDSDLSRSTSAPLSARSLWLEEEEDWVEMRRSKDGVGTEGGWGTLGRGDLNAGLRLWRIKW